MSNNELIKILSDYKTFSRIADEAEKEKKKLANIIRDYMGSDTEKIIAEYKITYKEVKKLVADSDKMKACGIFDEYSKEQVSRPLYVR